MDWQSTLLLVALPSLGAGLMVGFWIGGRVVAGLILSEVVKQGFLNLKGVRYRVDRIGRRPSENSR
jgi:hypothetical protein